MSPTNIKWDDFKAAVRREYEDAVVLAVMKDPTHNPLATSIGVMARMLAKERELLNRDRR